MDNIFSRTNKQSSLKKIVLLSIIVIVALWVGSFFSRPENPSKYDVARGGQIKEKRALLAVTPRDHIFGPRDADIFLIEYADVNCPFCRNLHTKLKYIVENQEKGGVRIAWIYRHFPLLVSAGKIDPEERALECAYASGGDLMFFAYMNRMMDEAVERKNLTHEQLSDIARDLGLDVRLFADCVSSTIYDSIILHDHQIGRMAGVSLIPHTFFLTRGGLFDEITGNKPRSVYESIIHALTQ